MLEFTPVDERVASLRLRVGGWILTVVCTYGPNSSSEYPAFLDSLEGVLENTPPGELHELWVVTQRTRSWVEAAEMSFLPRVAGLSLRDRVRSSVIRRELGVDPLLLRVERSQMRRFEHLIRMPPGRLPGEVFRARPTGRRPRTRWRDYVSRLARERLGIPREELDEVAGEREVWASCLG